MVPPDLRPKAPWGKSQSGSRRDDPESPGSSPARGARGFYTYAAWAPVAIIVLAVGYFMFRLAEYLLLRA
jgi:hypothetical protein